MTPNREILKRIRTINGRTWRLNREMVRKDGWYEEAQKHEASCHEFMIDHGRQIEYVLKAAKTLVLAYNQVEREGGKVNPGIVTLRIAMGMTEKDAR